MKRFHLISAPFSCGISWMVSVLMELGIRTTHAEPRRYPNGFWRPLDDGSGADAIVPEGVEHMRYYLPVLQERNAFRFPEDIEVLWEHRLDFARHPDRPVILFARDPRDAIRSLYLRNYLHFEWMEYLRRPDRWQDHFPEMFDLPPTETWAAWHAMWMGLSSLVPVKLIRFEDTRVDPIRAVQDVLAVLGVQRPVDAIRKAVENSSLDRTRAAMERAEAETGVKFRVVRRGKVEEWRETFDEEALRVFGGPAAEWMRTLGYEPAQASLDTGVSWGIAGDEALPGLVEFRARWNAGDVVAARDTLRRTIAEVQSPGRRDADRLRVAASWVALDWTSRVLGDPLRPTPCAGAILSAFEQFLLQFGEWPSIRRMLLEAIGAVQPVSNPAFASLNGPGLPVPAVHPSPAPTPAGQLLLVEEDYRGYRLYGFRGRFYGVLRSAEDIDLATLSKDALNAERKRGRVFVGDLGFEVKQSIDERSA